MKIILISCVKKKLNIKAKAKDMYISTQFKKEWEYANLKKPDKIFILSAKHGLLDPEKVIEPYKESLNDKKKNERQKWANRVINQLKDVSDLEQDNFEIVAGKRYYEYLMDHLQNNLIFSKKYNIKGQGYFISKLKNQIEILKRKQNE